MYRCDNCGEIIETCEETSPCCDAPVTELHECECCHVNLIAVHEDYCEECLRDFDGLMNEVQASLGCSYKTIIAMTERWLDHV